MKYLIVAGALFIVCGCEKDVKEVLAPAPGTAIPRPSRIDTSVANAGATHEPIGSVDE
jgi:hypothetical protein